MQYGYKRCCTELKNVWLSGNRTPASSRRRKNGGKRVLEWQRPYPQGEIQNFITSLMLNIVDMLHTKARRIC